MTLINLKILQNKIRLILFSLWCLIANMKGGKKSGLYKNILIVQAGKIGDGILVLGALRRLEEIFNPQLGYKLTLVCDESCEDMFYHNIGNTIKVISLKTKSKWPCIYDYKGLVKRLDNFSYEKCIVFFSASWGDYLTMCVKADTRISALCCMKRRNAIVSFILKKTYDICIERKDGEFVANACEKVMHYLGDIDYKAQKQLFYYSYGFGERTDREYVIVAPRASMLYRSLPDEQVLNILEYILKNTKVDILLTGMKEEYPYLENIIQRFHNERILNYAGKTTMGMFVSLLRKAKFLISADSGQVHMAAALDVPCICMTGYWQVGEFLPYNFAVSTSNDNIVSIYGPKMYCANCVGIFGKQGKGNKECLKKIKEGHSALCLEKIDMDDIYTAINQVMSIVKPLSGIE